MIQENRKRGFKQWIDRYSAAWKEWMKMTDLVAIVGRGLMFRGITTAAVQLR